MISEDNIIYVPVSGGQLLPRNVNRGVKSVSASPWHCMVVQSAVKITTLSEVLINTTQVDMLQDTSTVINPDVEFVCLQNLFLHFCTKAEPTEKRPVGELRAWRPISWSSAGSYDQVSSRIDSRRSKEQASSSIAVRSIAYAKVTTRWHQIVNCGGVFFCFEVYCKWKSHQIGWIWSFLVFIMSKIVKTIAIDFRIGPPDVLFALAVRKRKCSVRSCRNQSHSPTNVPPGNWWIALWSYLRPFTACEHQVMPCTSSAHRDRCRRGVPKCTRSGLMSLNLQATSSTQQY